MRRATLVLGLQTQEVLMGEVARYAVWNNPRPLIASDGEMLIPTEEISVTERIVPITQFCYGNGKPDLYVAYSQEVEELLGMPFRIILKEKSDAIAEADRLRNLTAWEHIKSAYRIIMSEIKPRGRS